MVLSAISPISGSHPPCLLGLFVLLAVATSIKIDLPSLGIATVTSIVVGLAILAYRLKRRLAAQALELHACRQRYQQIFERNPAGMCRMSLEEEILDCNDAFARILGYASRAELLSRPTHVLWDDSAGAESFLALLNKHKTVTNYERQLRRNDGTRVWVLQNATLLEASDNSPAVIEAMLIDITEHKKAQESVLQQSETNYRSLVEGSPYGIIRSTAAGKFLMVNPALVTMLGYDSQAEILALNAASELYQDPSDRLKILALFQGTRHVENIEVNWKKKDGRPILVRARGRLIRDDQGTECFESIVEDITERRMLEDNLRQAQKMEAIGQLAGGIAHDFNNLLLIILGQCHQLLAQTGPTDPGYARLQEIQAAAERAKSLTTRLLIFGRRKPLEFDVLDLNAALSELRELLQHLVGENILLVARLSPLLKQVKADRGLLEQVIINLAGNARDAMPDGGTLTIITANASTNETSAVEHPGVPCGQFVTITLCDTGIGMDSATQNRVFEPYFTTKGPGKGTGLGLAMVQSIVAQSGGHVTVASEPGHGSKFTIYLPAVQEITLPEMSAPQMPESYFGSETVLLVEDERSVRLLIREFLQSSGYVVIEAETGQQALRLAQAHQGPIHLLVTDIVMPKMSGHELARELSASRPALKVLCMSGYPGKRSQEEGASDDERRFLQKPFVMKLLLKEVRKILDSAA
ncbi:MAG: PAS domain S-box protein [Acidipila sp.]|nr:PAS domain S-box protein [Acidipila sp.]